MHSFDSFVSVFYGSICRRTSGGERGSMQFEDTASAAEAAAKCANEAVAAAQAAAILANKDSFNHQAPPQAPCYGSKFNISSVNIGHENLSRGSISSFMPDGSAADFQSMDHQSKAPGRTYESQSFDRSHYSHNVDTVDLDNGKFCRRHSYNVQSTPSDIKFDESDCDEEIEMEAPPSGVCPPPERNPPPLPSASHAKNNPGHRVHPKLPDYDALAARFEALKYHKSQK